MQKNSLSKGLKSSSVNRDVCALKTLISKAKLWKFVSDNPLSKIKPLPESDGRIRYLSPEERDRLFKVLLAREESRRTGRDSHNRFRAARGKPVLPDLRSVEYTDHLLPMVILSRETGMRRGECCKILWTDINFHNRTIHIRAEISKSNRERYIPLTDLATETLTRWRKQSSKNQVFPGSVYQVRTVWVRVRHLADLDDFNWHDFRHDFASRLVMQSVDLNCVRDLLGHKDMKTTLRYAHLAPNYKDQAIGKLIRDIPDISHPPPKDQS